MVSYEFAFNNPQFADRILHLEVATPSMPSIAESVSYDVEGQQEKMEKTSKRLHVSSVILAAHSEYFMTLFSNGMSESSCGTVSVKVTEREVQGLELLIEYMYTGCLRDPCDAETAVLLLCLADRFAISSCMEPLVNVLRSFPCSVNDCLLVLALPESLKSNKAVQPIVRHCYDHIAEQFSDIMSKHQEFLALGVKGVKLVLDSALLKIHCEEDIFDLMVDWLEANCADSLEAKTQAAEEISEVVRFPWMTGDFLVDVVSTHPAMQSISCQAIILEALKFRSFTHSRQQTMMWQKLNHNRYRARSNTILENFWGNSKTHVIKETDTSCAVYFEFPLELVVCAGKHFQSRSFYLGPNRLFTFYLEARQIQCPLKSLYNAQYTCCLSIVLSPNPLRKLTSSDCTFLMYTLSMKRDYPENYLVKENGTHDLQSVETSGTCIKFNDIFPGFPAERGFNTSRWNPSVSGPVFFLLNLSLEERSTFTKVEELHVGLKTNLDDFDKDIEKELLA